MMKTYQYKINKRVDAIQYTESNLRNVLLAIVSQPSTTKFSIENNFGDEVIISLKDDEDEWVRLDIMDYLVIHADGNLEPVTQRHFEKYYEELVSESNNPEE